MKILQRSQKDFNWRSFKDLKKIFLKKLYESLLEIFRRFFHGLAERISWLFLDRFLFGIKSKILHTFVTRFPGGIIQICARNFTNMTESENSRNFSKKKLEKFIRIGLILKIYILSTHYFNQNSNELKNKFYFYFYKTNCL